AQRFPVEKQSYMRVGGKLAPLAAFEIGVENESSTRNTIGIWAMPFQQHHPNRRKAFGICGGKGHRIAVIDFAGARFGIPSVEKGVGISTFHLPAIG
ncbi:MAG: hypothetical protein RIQ28_1264, partial [Pseudomonadota bacterium]